ncbi:MAG: hypothetical protein Q8R25_01625 [bacterium]|nr:hypothetical protein [bacterium]
MERVVGSAEFTKNRDFAKFHKRDPIAEEALKLLSATDHIKLRFGPVQVGEVDFGEWDKGDPRYGTPRRMPLYLFQHDGHISVNYPAGFPGHNERLTCHCGHNHYFASSRYRELRALGQLFMYRLRNG